MNDPEVLIAALPNRIKDYEDGYNFITYPGHLNKEQLNRALTFDEDYLDTDEDEDAREPSCIKLYINYRQLEGNPVTLVLIYSSHRYELKDFDLREFGSFLFKRQDWSIHGANECNIKPLRLQIFEGFRIFRVIKEHFKQLNQAEPLAAVPPAGNPQK